MSWRQAPDVNFDSRPIVNQNKRFELDFKSKLVLGLVGLALGCGYVLARLGPEKCDPSVMYGDACAPRASQSR